MTILLLLIINNEGIGLYSKTFNGFEFSDLEESSEIDQLLSGFIASIGNVGRRFFKQDIATINFGQNSDSVKITVINREMFQENKTINFVVFYRGEESINILRELVTSIYMENKNFFKQDVFDLTLLKRQIDNLLVKKYSGIYV